MKTVRAEFKLIHEDAKVPSKKRIEDAGYDVYSIEEGTVYPSHGLYADDLDTLQGHKEVFKTGVRISVPTGYFISIRGRSGLGFKGLQPFIGTLDATYNGELVIMLENHSNSPYTVNKGDRIAQIIIEEQIIMETVEVEEFSPEYDKRGKAGFGSSGK